MNRAYSLLDARAFDDATRQIEGIASTPSPDRYGDVVEPLGAQFALPMALLWQHNAEKPVGTVEFAKPTKSGIPFMGASREDRRRPRDAQGSRRRSVAIAQGRRCALCRSAFARLSIRTWKRAACIFSSGNGSNSRL